jgi:threonine dehydratase
LKVACGHRPDHPNQLLSVGTSPVASFGVDLVHQKNVVAEPVSAALALVAHCHHSDQPNQLFSVISLRSVVISHLSHPIHQMKTLSEPASSALVSIVRGHRPSDPIQSHFVIWRLSAVT